MERRKKWSIIIHVKIHSIRTVPFFLEGGGQDGVTYVQLCVHACVLAILGPTDIFSLKKMTYQSIYDVFQ